MLSRRSFLAAVASALVAARAGRIAAGNAMRRLDGSVAIPVPEEDTLGRLIASFLNVGDIITFGRDPREYRVLALDAHAVHLAPVPRAEVSGGRWVWSRVARRVRSGLKSACWL
jgi:hypothetical protein